MNIINEVLVLLLLVCQVYTEPVQPEKCTVDAAKGIHSDGSTCTFNVCRYPAKVPDTAGTVENRCNNMKLLKEYLKLTKGEIRVIKGLLKAMTKTRRCRHQIQKLNKRHLEDVITIDTSSTIASLNESTKTYFALAQQVNLIYHLEFRLAPSIQECCLTYPKEVGDYLKNKMLKKWFTLQDKCGDAIDETQCDVILKVDLNGPTGCHRTADIIYLLLKSTQKVLEDSIPVLRSQIRKSRKRSKKNRS